MDQEEKKASFRGFLGRYSLSSVKQANKPAPRPDASLVDEMDALVATKRYEY